MCPVVALVLEGDSPLQERAKRWMEEAGGWRVSSSPPLGMKTTLHLHLQIAHVFFVCVCLCVNGFLLCMPVC